MNVQYTMYTKTHILLCVLDFADREVIILVILLIVTLISGLSGDLIEQ